MFNVFSYSSQTIAQVSAAFSVNIENGLDKKVVVERLEKFGRNKLILKQTTGLYIFLRQFKSSFIYLLIAALAITLFMGEVIDSLMIFAFLLINTGLGFYQEYSSEKTAQLLNQYTLPRARVLRDGKVEQITADLLVPGDVIVLETGDKVPADIRIIENDDLTIDETVLTGESVPVFKKSETINVTPSSYADAINLAFCGTDVLRGEARALVVATGRNTAFGKIAGLATEAKKVSDFERGISRFSQFILKMVGITLVLVFVAHLLIKRDTVNVLELVVFSVALTVSVIPEALPLVTTFSLARGAKRLARKKVIVKRLSAIEDLGAIEILCSDKTGTLTKNEMSIVGAHADDKGQAIWLANLASDFELAKKIEPFDIAIEAGLNVIQKKSLKKIVKIAEQPFDPKLKLNAALVKDGDNKLVLRGALESILSYCEDLDKKTKTSLLSWVREEGVKGHRALAVAYKKIKGVNLGVDTIDKEIKHNNFIFGGAIAFVDPIKESSFKAVEQAKKLGVKIIIITGDSAEVAGAVAHEIGLIKAPDAVITGDVWQKASGVEQINYLNNYNVFARVSPEQKFSIIKSLRERHAIGFLGEGINDAPALKIAGVSIVVDSAADVARETADIILIKKNLDVIIDGIKEGRMVFANTTKYIKSTLASNFGNFFAVATSSLMIKFLPMLPIQILLVNLLSDTPMIAISTDNVDHKELKSPRKYEAKEIIIISMVLGLISTIFDFIFFGLFYRISPSVLQTNWFIGSILTELVLLFSIRTPSIFTKTMRPSKSIIWLSLVTFILTVGLPFTPFGQKFFQFTPPSAIHLTIILSLVVVYFIVSELAKLTYYKHFKKI